MWRKKNWLEKLCQPHYCFHNYYFYDKDFGSLSPLVIWDSESFGTVQTGYCLKVFPEDRGWQVYFESIGLNFFGWFLLSTLSLSFALPTFHRTLGWGSIPRQWICDNHAFVQFDVELNISCTNGAEEEFLRKIDLFQSDAGRWNKDISLGRGEGTSLLQSAPFPIDSHYKESLRRGL